jgi:4-hydroxy-3-polyprenylbenzoate decarboxylase
VLAQFRRRGKSRSVARNLKPSTGNIRELIAALAKSNLLLRVDREINKDTELHPLVRLQFRGLPEADRKAFLFTKVTDVSGRCYDIPVVVACLAGSRQIYGVGLQCDPDKISQRWTHARNHPIRAGIRRECAGA